MSILALEFNGSTMAEYLPWAIFTFCLGACVGSFINVVIYRTPMGMSLLYPSSRCPICGGQLRFFRENLPILGWLILRGRCRQCRARISPVYAVVELAMALVFLGLYTGFFWISFQDPWWGVVAGQWWDVQQFIRAWPAFVNIAFLIAALYAMTIIDARTFTIPIQIPNFITVTAFVLWPLQGVLARQPFWLDTDPWPIPGVNWTWCLIALGGVIGVLVGCWLLWSGRLRYSFADYADFVEEGETLGNYPHGRREMGVEARFLLIVLVGMAMGWLVGSGLADQVPPVWAQALGGSMLGYLVGAGLVWAIRLLGTLGFGREAMGMGDVHLLGCVGAVLGWFDPILIFFLAPFIGLLFTFFAWVASAFGTRRRELPYGPHLAVATLAVLLARPLIVSGWEAVLPQVPMPARALIVKSEAPPAAASAGAAIDRMSTTLYSRVWGSRHRQEVHDALQPRLPQSP